MYLLNKPNLAISDVLALCFGGISDPSLASRMVAAKSAIEANEPKYDALATKAQLDLFPQQSTFSHVDKSELVSLYDDHLSSQRGTARSVYDSIRNAAVSRLCPLCSIGSVAVVDHHLPKSRYPDLSVLPLNLVPACHFCNDTKKARFSKAAGDQTFHPYYDAHLLAHQWITAKIDYASPPVLIFKVSPPLAWSPTDRQRVARHFLVCGLSTSFSTNANAGLGPLKRRLELLHSRGGVASVKAYLEEERNCRNQQPNSWQHVFFQTLAADNWFVSGGFNQIAHP